MARNLTRSRRGVRGSLASCMTRRLNSSQERSRLKKGVVLREMGPELRRRVVAPPRAAVGGLMGRFPAGGGMGAPREVSVRVAGNVSIAGGRCAARLWELWGRD